jgi:hypothetical protein
VICDTAAQPLWFRREGRGLAAPVTARDPVRITDTNAWLTLPKNEADPEYAELMNGVLDDLEPGMIGR